MSKTSVERVAGKLAGIKLAFENHLSEKHEVEFVPEGEGSFPWDECIAKMLNEYGDEETAKNVCGSIKAKYGS